MLGCKTDANVNRKSTNYGPTIRSGSFPLDGERGRKGRHHLYIFQRMATEIERVNVRGQKSECSEQQLTCASVGGSVVEFSPGVRFPANAASLFGQFLKYVSVCLS